MDIQTIINDINIVIEAIDTFSARAMLVDIQQDLEIIALPSENKGLQ